MIIIKWVMTWLDPIWNAPYGHKCRWAANSLLLLSPSDSAILATLHSATYPCHSPLPQLNFTICKAFVIPTYLTSSLPFCPPCMLPLSTHCYPQPILGMTAVSSLGLTLPFQMLGFLLHISNCILLLPAGPWCNSLPSPGCWLWCCKTDVFRTRGCSSWEASKSDRCKLQTVTGSSYIPASKPLIGVGYTHFLCICSSLNCDKRSLVVS